MGGLAGGAVRPCVFTQMANIKDKKALVDMTRRITEIEEENVMLKRNLEALKTKAGQAINLEEKQIEDRVAQQIQRQHDSSSLLIEGVYKNRQESLKDIVKQIAFDTTVQVLYCDIVKVFRL